jgi:uncharacterized membrane protein
MLLVGTGGVGGAGLGLPVLLGLLTGGLLGLLVLKLAPDCGAEADRGRTGAGGPPPQSAAALLRERYARGELAREQYMTMLEDLLKDRYVRGELDLDEYEARLDELLRERAARTLRS